MKIILKTKLLILVLIVSMSTSISFTGIMQVSAETNATNPHLALGSSAYILKIQSISSQIGYKSALSEIMKDVEKNGSDLDARNSPDVLRFYRLVSFVVSQIGYVDMQTHYFRNKLNRAPGSLAKMIALNKTLPVSKRWVLLSPINSEYHMQGPDGMFNLKFVSYSGFCEAVYNKRGVLLSETNDPINMGTFNYAAGIPGVFSHELYDVTPYLRWGNTANSPQKGNAMISKYTNIASNNYKVHAREVFVYRKNLFGMQQGKVI